MSNITRIIPLTNDFMNHKKNDLFYAYLISKANYKKETNQLFVEYDIYEDSMIDLFSICNCKSKKTLTNYLQDYIKDGFITIEEIKWYGKIEKCLVFKNKFDLYQKVDNDIIPYLYNTTNKNSIKIYTYLLNKYRYYSKNKEQCYFTYKELAIAMGYTIKDNGLSKTVSKNIQDILFSFVRQEILEYTEVNTKCAKSKIGYITVKRIKKIAETINDMKQVKIEIEDGFIPQQSKQKKKIYTWEDDEDDQDKFFHSNIR